MMYTRSLTALLWALLTLTVCVTMGVAKRSPTALSDEMLESNKVLSTPFTEEDIDELVDWHNLARSSVSPHATNMEFIDWDPYLQDVAQRWAEECLWAHGQPSDVVGSYGQNLWAISQQGTVKAETVIDSWESEKHYYNYSSNACKPGKQCGHYTQIVWSTTNSIGCGRAFCPTLQGAAKNMWIVVCQYSPAGNIVGHSPYTAGPPCSRCESGVGQCYENLCRSCDDHDEQCDCRQTCQNCGTVDTETCTCDCPRGFYGTDCSKMCANLHPYCGRNPGFPNSKFCRYHPMIPRLCPKMCGVCTAPDENMSCEEPTTKTTTEVKTTPAPVNEYNGVYIDKSQTGLTNNAVDDKHSRMRNDAVDRM